jgi:hypothetical protein
MSMEQLTVCIHLYCRTVLVLRFGKAHFLPHSYTIGKKKEVRLDVSFPMISASLENFLSAPHLNALFQRFEQ